MASPSSSDEGEIIETGVGAGDLKATSLPQFNGNGVDRPDRNRPRHSKSTSPEVDAASRYASTSTRNRSPRGSKRSRSDYPARSNGDRDRDRDPRNFRVHYEDARDSRRSHFSYDDDDRPPSRSSASGLRYDDRDRARDHGPSRDHSRERERDRDGYADKRPRNRTRSPNRPPRSGRDRNDRDRRKDDRHTRPSNRDQDFYDRNGRQDSARHDAVRGSASAERNGILKNDTKSTKLSQVEVATTPSSANTSAPEPEAPEEQPVDEAAEIERRRRRREELLAKSRGPTPMLVQALQASSDKFASTSPAHIQQSTPSATEANTPMSGKSVSNLCSCDIANKPQAVSSPASPARGLQEGMSPAALDITNDHDLINVHGESRNADDDDGPSAADYDPTADMREDEKRDGRRHGHIGPHGEVLPPEQKDGIAPQEEMQPTESTEDGDDFDMFAEDFDEDKFAAPKPIVESEATADDGQAPAQVGAGGILEGDDKDGYYKIRIGEIMNGRYQVQATLGKGMFSGVARAVDITNKQMVAIKMMRNNDALRKGGFTEIAILQKLNDSDPENRKHIVKFERHFEHKGHLCLAFENLSLNLREVLKKFGNNVGINLSATRSYAHQMFVALAHMRKCTIIHADIKPDNILVNEARNILKICDLGTAIDRSDAATAHNEITPYLVSRFYRAPEIILGLPYDYAVDMWSIGCTLYELYTGKILFTGDSNNQMLKTIMEIRGKFSTKMYKRGQLWQMHFDDIGNFISVERDKVLDKTNVRTMAIVKPTRDLRTRLMAASSGMDDAESRDLNHFIDLLERCLALNPDKRMTPSEALKHPFFLRASIR
ncbi:kinase-like domain-containing protein [Truncatella angustata]|uniref:non-specific serine/threonine protein kinase n=1 Tax=Truncatella angustata TaxID=152316 RepID=A0A9P8RIB1_9PEZI|nr:kinase-like domain-containing protein [Truncatella angustata]KAH6646392.1 kinase-like domain-containing protein [Truncatella angustata]